MMHNTFGIGRRWIAFLAAGCMVLACKSKKPQPDEAEKVTVSTDSAEKSGAPKQIKEIEPNDSPSTATPISGSASVEGELKVDSKKADEDIFRIEALGPKKAVSFEVSGIPGVDVAIDVLDRDGNKIATFDSEGSGKGEKTTDLGSSAPLLVKVYSVKKGEGGSYAATVTVSDAQQGTEVEPNNRAVDANPLVMGKPIKGLLSDRNDEDWYAFEVPVPAAATATPQTDGGDAENPTQEVAAPLLPAVIRLDISGVPGARLQVEVANQAQAVFYTAKAKEEGDGIQVRNLALRPGETSYFVIVRAFASGAKNAKRGFNKTVPYSLTLAVEESSASAELEPNDEPTKATPFTGDGAKFGYLAPKGDVDFYQVQCDKPSLLKIDLSGVDRIDSILSLVRYDPDTSKEEVLLKANDGGIREGELLVNLFCGPEKNALLKVETAPRQVEGKWVRDQENATEKYKLTVTSKADNGSDEREPNGTAATATPIALGKSIKGLVHPKRDIDYFRLDVSNSPVKVPLKATVTGILKVDISLSMHRLEEDGTLTLVQRSEKAKGEQPETIRYSVEPGVYIFEVRDTKNYNSNYLDAYQLVVEQE